ncbi:MAG: D-amino-acid transaminase [Hyphomicrobium sp.]
MSRIIYVNGRYRPSGEAAVHAEDRGFQFADAIYEVIEVRAGALVDERRHLDRLDRSLGEIRMGPPMAPGALRNVIKETIKRNRVRDGLVYIQVTRGAGPRDFALPGPDQKQTVVVIARSQAASAIAAAAETGISVMSKRDPRWERCDIKTVMLLPAVLAKDEAKAQGAREVWFLDDAGFVTEGASSNAWIVTTDGKLVTHGLDRSILPGVTRATAIDAAQREGLNFEERAFSLKEALGAREAFITSATNTVMPVVRIDGTAIGSGRPGPLTLRLRSSFHHVAEISFL